MEKQYKDHGMYETGWLSEHKLRANLREEFGARIILCILPATACSNFCKPFFGIKNLSSLRKAYTHYSLRPLCDHFAFGKLTLLFAAALRPLCGRFATTLRPLCDHFNQCKFPPTAGEGGVGFRRSATQLSVAGLFGPGLGQCLWLTVVREE